MSKFNFSLFKQTVKDVVSSAAMGALDTASEAKDLLEKALSAKCLRGLSVKSQIGTGGPDGIWKLYNAERKKKIEGKHQKMTVWLLEKRILNETQKGSKTHMHEPLVQLIRNNALNMTKLKHPGILSSIETMEETRTQFIMVTEPIFCCLRDWLEKFTRIPHIDTFYIDTEISELEKKHGILEVANALDFLHTEANLVHCAISPESIYICEDGHWKISNLEFCSVINFSDDHEMSHIFNYPNYQEELYEKLTKPALQYTAPELALCNGERPGAVKPASDIFSLGCVIYEIFSNQKLFPIDNIHDIRSRLSSISQQNFSFIHNDLQQFLKSMLSLVIGNRPQAAAIPSCIFFQGDILIRAMQFLSVMVNRENTQKSDFLSNLKGFWDKFDKRIIRYKVLPPLMLELQNPALQHLAVPFVFKAVAEQETDEFRYHTFPMLQDILDKVKGETLAIVISNLNELTRVMSKEVAGELFMKLLTRGMDEQIPSVQEESLKQAQSLLSFFTYEQIKTHLLPRVHVTALRTQSAKVRGRSLSLLETSVTRMDKDESINMLNTCFQIANVDKSSLTVMGIFGIGNEVSKQWGLEITADKVLPLLFPLIISKNIRKNDFDNCQKTIEDMVSYVLSKTKSRIEEIEPVSSSTMTSGNKQLSSQNSGWDSEFHPHQKAISGTMMDVNLKELEGTREKNDNLDALMTEINLIEKKSEQTTNHKNSVKHGGRDLFGEFVKSSEVKNNGSMMSISKQPLMSFQNTNSFFDNDQNKCNLNVNSLMNVKQNSHVNQLSQMLNEDLFSDFSSSTTTFVPQPLPNANQSLDLFNLDNDVKTNNNQKKDKDPFLDLLNF